MFESDYPEIFEKKLSVLLRKYGFTRVNLTGCMKPELLFRRGSLWLASSWDARENYFEFDLGHLFSCKDVMTRFEVLGDYGLYCPRVNELTKTDTNYREQYLDLVADTLRESIQQFESDYESIKSADISRHEKFNPKYLEFLDRKASRREWTKYKT